jgi:ADP-ribose pyrophosphatase YjhB (NUDIX family)
MQAVEKEVWEETGFRVRSRKVIAVFDRERQGHPPHAFHTWKVFMLCEIVGGEAHAQGDGLEIDEVAFFPESPLPPLSLPRILPSQIALCFEHERAPSRPTDFD